MFLIAVDSLLAGWIKLPLTSIGEVNLEDTNVQLFSFGDFIPLHTQEVLLYAYVQIGSPINIVNHIRYYTQYGDDLQFDMYLYVTGPAQNGFTMASANMWLPVTAEQRVRVQVPNAISGNKDARVYIIGYR